jgi:hypothetical protein
VHVQTKSDAVGGVIWEVTNTRPGPPTSPGRRPEKGAAEAGDEALERSRGGLTTKLHLACDGRGRPLVVVFTPGQRHDSTQLGSVGDTSRVPRPGNCGRPRKRSDYSGRISASAERAGRGGRSSLIMSAIGTAM